MPRPGGIVSASTVGYIRVSSRAQRYETQRDAMPGDARFDAGAVDGVAERALRAR